MLDWEVNKAITYAVNNNILPQPRVNWKRSYSFDFPEQHAIDEDKKAKAVERKLASGQMTYEEHYGPDWKEKFDQIGDEQEYIREKGIVLPAFVTQSTEEIIVEEGDENGN